LLVAAPRAPAEVHSVVEVQLMPALGLGLAALSS
jgi:hypothetical protein